MEGGGTPSDKHNTKGRNSSWKNTNDMAIHHGAQFPPKTDSLFNRFFLPENKSWEKWSYDIERYDILGDKIIEKKREAKKKDDLDDDSGQDVLSDQPIDDEFINKVEF